MKQSNHVEVLEGPAVAQLEKTELFLPLLLRESGNAPSPTRPLVVIGELIAIKNKTQTPLVLYPGQKGSSPVAARSTVELQVNQIGKPVLLVFETDENTDPIVIGVLHGTSGSPAREQSTPVDVQVDGDRMTLCARKQLVLRCGRASVTLTEEGKILIQGTYISSRSSGVHRIKGGYVQIN